MSKKKKESEFDYKKFEEEAIKKLRSGKGLSGPDGALTGLIKRLIEASMEGEISDQLEGKQPDNRRNGYSKKTLKTSFGPVEVNPPRDRLGEFEPQIVGKHDRSLAPGVESQILELYALGNSYLQIQAYLEKMYGVHFSVGRLSAVTEKVWEAVVEWQNRPLDSVYALLYLDAIHYKVREDGKVRTKAIYTILGVDLEGYRDVLGLYIDAAEGAKYWGRVLDKLKDRGVEDVLFFSIDGLKGFSDAITSVFPHSIIQRCIVHMIRTSLKHVSYKDYKTLCKDLRQVYSAPSLAGAELALASFGQKWDNTYPEIREKWEANWLELSAFFDWPEPIRKMIYTTNAVEALHRHLRKVTKTKGAFVSEKALLKQLYLALDRSRKSWARRARGWPAVIRVLTREFSDRLEGHV